MKRLTVLAIVVAALAALVVVAALSGVLPLLNRDDSARPACGQLASKKSVETALASNADLVRRLEAAGSDVKVGVGTPCDNADQALVRVSYDSDDERAEIDEILREADGFGVPVEVVSG